MASGASVVASVAPGAPTSSAPSFGGGSASTVVTSSGSSIPFHTNFMVKQRVASAVSASARARVKTVGAIFFGMLSGEDMMRASTLAVTTRDMYKLGTRRATAFGPLDPRMGVCNKADACGTCGQKINECAGHWGYVKLELPVFHIGFLRSMVETLQTVCKTCARVLLPAEARASYLKQMRASASDALRKQRLRKRVVEEVKKISTATSICCCPWCGAINGQVKKVPGAMSFKIIHDRYKSKSAASADSKGIFQESLHTMTALDPDINSHLKRAVEVLNPILVRDLLSRIPPDDCDLLWTSTDRGHPMHMILTHVPVPPIAIRPSVPMDAGGGTNEDDLTVKIQEIIQINSAVRLALSKAATLRQVMENWDSLQNQVAALINGELPGLPATMKPKRPIRGLSQRLKGKQGRFRGNLSGKRVDFSSRTVISPDANLPVYCVGVPLLVATTLTYPEHVTETNLAEMRRLVLNGSKIHPGANYVRPAVGMPRHLQYADTARASRELRVGDVVERHLRDGDCVLFNRQPSLHKMSIMCHRAVVQPGRTFRFNECVCTPYNADFDGDEMNLHLPQTEEARAEAAMLMDVRENLITPRSGEPLIGATQDFLTAAYLLTQRDTFLTRDEIAQAAATLGDACEHVDLPPPAVLKPVPLWTGKQVFSLLLRPNRTIKVHATFEMKARNNVKPNYECPVDGWVVFRDGQLMIGTLDKASLGGGSKVGLVYTLCRDNHPSVAARALHRLTKMTSRWLQNWGCSIGIEDVTPSAALSALKANELNRGYAEADKSITQYRQGKLALKAGCNEEQSLESVLTGLLSKLRSSMGDVCMEQLSRHNSPKIMAICGSKGSSLNISQMIACVGQQSVGGSRIAEGFVDRTLPTFPTKAKEPAAKGFVANSFYTGLIATEFFFHTMGGREGLVDTAVKTAETGYMQRRMMKALEDLSVQYDRTVRTAGGDIVQFAYGDDGLDPAYMENNKRPVDLKRALMNAIVASRAGDAHLSADLAHVGTTVASLAQARVSGNKLLMPSTLYEPALAPKEVQAVLAGALATPSFAGVIRKNDHGTQRFLQDIHSFIDSDVVGIMTNRWTTMLGAGADISVITAADASAAGAAMTPAQEAAAVIHHTCRVTRTELLCTLEEALGKFRRAQIQAGEAVGALAAHSLGEPATQMTLKTFHFAGVASMNVTLGVPRIKEIMNASKNISTPIITAPLEMKTNEVVARIVKARLEKTVLGDIARHIREVYTEREAYLEVKLDLEAINALRLDEVTSHSVGKAIQHAPKLRLKQDHVTVEGRDIIKVRAPVREAASRARAARQRAKEKEKEAERAALDGRPASGAIAADSDSDEDLAALAAKYDPDEEPDEEDEEEYDARRRGGRAVHDDYFSIIRSTQRDDTYFCLQALKAALPLVVVQGIPTVSRAVITEDEKRSRKYNAPKYKLLVEGYDLLRVMGTPGVKARKAQSNHITEMAAVLGIEAARVTIMKELANTYNTYGIGIDQRHLQLLADVMTYRGEILGVTRFGIAKMKDSVLMLASFEKTPDHLFDAAIHSRTDWCKGVSESIIIGAPIPVGTGMFRLLHDHASVLPSDGSPALTRRGSTSSTSLSGPSTPKMGLVTPASGVPTPLITSARVSVPAGVMEALEQATSTLLVE